MVMTRGQKGLIRDIVVGGGDDERLSEGFDHGI